MTGIIFIQDSRIVIGEQIVHLRKYLPPGQKVIVITEESVYSIYQNILRDYEVIRIRGGEIHKSWETIDRITGELIRLEADRNTFIVGFGGGIVCDITGFVASIYMRGCRFGFVPTTLLAQVDASVGGKNGVNYHGYKNILGVFNQPEFVICDPEVLDTLDDREYAAGFSEIVKAAMIADAGLFCYMEEHVKPAWQKDRACLEVLVKAAVNIKASIVERDMKEGGVRRLLNLGHTFAHALEKNGIPLHGEAVSIGLCMASRLSVCKGYMSEEEAERVRRLLELFHLPIRTSIAVSQLLNAMRKDKKRDKEHIHLILPIGIGQCKEEFVSFAELESLIAQL